MTAAGVNGVAGVEPVSKFGKGEGGRVEKVTTAVGVRTAIGVNEVEQHHGQVRPASAVWIQLWQGSMGRYGFGRVRG